MANFTSQNADADQIHALLGLYFDGLYHSDTARLRQVFHPAALYAAVMDGALKNLPLDQYWPVVDARPSPASYQQPRRDKILAVDIVGPTTALAKVECAIERYFYTDLLSLIKLDGKWWIIAKVFHGANIAETLPVPALAD